MVSPRAPGERWRARRGLAANRRKRLLLGWLVVYLHRGGEHLANALTALLQVGPCRLIDVGLLVIERCLDALGDLAQVQASQAARVRRCRCPAAVEEQHEPVIACL